MSFSSSNIYSIVSSGFCHFFTVRYRWTVLVFRRNILITRWMLFSWPLKKLITILKDVKEIFLQLWNLFDDGTRKCDWILMSEKKALLNNPDPSLPYPLKKPTIISTWSKNISAIVNNKEYNENSQVVVAEKGKTGICKKVRKTRRKCDNREKRQSETVKLKCHKPCLSNCSGYLEVPGSFCVALSEVQEAFEWQGLEILQAGE